MEKRVDRCGVLRRTSPLPILRALPGETSQASGIGGQAGYPAPEAEAVMRKLIGDCGASGRCRCDADHDVSRAKGVTGKGNRGFPGRRRAEKDVGGVAAPSRMEAVGSGHIPAPSSSSDTPIRQDGRENTEEHLCYDLQGGASNTGMCCGEAGHHRWGVYFGCRVGS
jgi:hypothetical protein